MEPAPESHAATRISRAADNHLSPGVHTNISPAPAHISSPRLDKVAFSPARAAYTRPATKSNSAPW